MARELLHEEYLFMHDTDAADGGRLCLLCSEPGASWVSYQCKEGLRHMLFCTGHGETVVAAGPTLCETCATFAEIVAVRAADPSMTSHLASPDGR
jgi:hypothetical protein